MGLPLPRSQSYGDREDGGGQMPPPPAARLVLAMGSVGGQPGAAVPRDAFLGTFHAAAKLQTLPRLCTLKSDNS